MTAPDPAILAAAIKCASEDLHLQRTSAPWMGGAFAVLGLRKGGRT